MITFLKLGGSLITDKNKAHTARADVLRRLGSEIRTVMEADPSPLIIGHGSGSFGHIPAKKYGTRSGVRNDAEWLGFAEVHSEATALNRTVTDMLREAGLPILSFVPMDNIQTADGAVTVWDTAPIREALSHRLIPMVFGDTVFDSVRGGTILSTEDLFVHLCGEFGGEVHILLAGLEEGVWRDFPQKTQLIPEISADENGNDGFIRGSEFTDVTGGMHEKVHLMKTLVSKNRALSARIFSGETPGNLEKALKGEPIGTAIIP